MASMRSKAEAAQPVSLEAFGNDVMRRRAALIAERGEIAMPRNTGTRRTPQQTRPAQGD